MKYLFGLFLSFLFFYVEAQESGIAGKVNELESGEALIGVHVFYDEAHGIATDLDGRFQFTLLPGIYHLRFHYLGYDEKRVDVLVTENKISELEISLQPSTTLLQGVVVSAGRFEQKLSDVTVSMEVMKPNFIEKLNVVTMETALNKVPGLSISDGQASIRGGNGWSYGVGSRVLILVDDLPMLSPDAGDAKFEFIPMENIAQVEIIKGAASALYGSSALNGAVNIRTAWPTKPTETKIILNNGIYLSPKREELKWWGKNIPFYHSTGFLHSRQKGNLDLVFGGNYYHDGGYRTQNFEDRFRYNLGIRYRDKKIKGLTYGVNTGFMNVDKIDFLMWKAAPDFVYIHDTASVSPTKGYRLNIDPFINFYSSRAGKHSLRSRFYRVVNNIEGDNLSNRGHQYFLEYQYHQKIKEKSSVTAGVSTLQANTKAELFGDHTSANYSLFAQFDTRLWDRLSVSLGTRWENYRLDEESASSMPLFRSGLNYQLADFTFLRTSFGQGYRFPTIAEKYTYTNLGGLLIIPNPNLEPETGWSTEIGIKQGIKVANWKGYIDVAAFLTEYENMMEFSFGAYDLANYGPITSETEDFALGFQSRNIGKARITGVEFSMNGTGSIGIFDVNLLAGYTYVIPVDLNTDSIYRTLKSNNDNYLKYRFSHLAKGDLEIGYRKYSLGVSYLYNSHIKNIDKYFEVGFVLPGLKEYREEHNKGFHTFDFRLAYETSDNFRFALYLKNAFNNEYMIRPGDIAAPRNVAMQVVMRF